MKITTTVRGKTRKTPIRPNEGMNTVHTDADRMELTATLERTDESREAARENMVNNDN